MNKKVINATSVSYDGINFKSKFEASIYKMLKESELKFSYEDYTITLMAGFYPTKTSYIPRKKRGIRVTEFKEKIRSMTYTPDFTVFNNDKIYLIEVKGYETDRYIVKRKLLLKYIDDKNMIFFEIHTKKDMINCIEFIKNDSC